MRVERAQYFLAAVEAGSLRAAAARCGISQPALGQQIDLLEEELNVVLLTRSRSGVRPTPAGQALLEPMARLVNAQEAVRAAATDSSGSYRGRVAIGSISSASETVVASVVGRLREQHPELRFSVTETDSAAIEDGVAAGELDFGIATMPANPPVAAIERMVLFQVPIGIVVRLDHLLADWESIRWSDLETWPIVTMREGTVLWERLHAGVTDPDVVMQAMSARSLKVMVSQGIGIGILSPGTSDVLDLRWIRVRDTPPLRICLVQRRDSQPSPAALTVRRLITERAAELLESAVSDQ